MIYHQSNIKTVLATVFIVLSFPALTQESIRKIENKGGPTLGYSTASGIKIIESGGLKFKDLNRNGKLDRYEDWRLSVDVRAGDLASQMSIEQIAGLMLYSGHQAIPAAPRGFGAATYNGKPFPESGARASDLTDQQKKFLTEDNLRHVLITRVQSAEVSAEWNNNVQALVEGLGLGIPANNSSDPRHGAVASTEYNAGAGGSISMWPDQLGMAATFDPKLVEKFGHIAAQEYRALGITTALSPQIDLGTEPRWSRFTGTFGEDPGLSTDMARAYVDGFQTSRGKAEISGGWGFQSVNTMVKHWPGGGPEEGGRDGHFAYGKFAVYPGGGFMHHLKPFIDGAFRLSGKTGKATAVMPYYTISFDQDSVYKENVGNAYSKYLITDLLRNKYGYDGVVCTDWLVTGNEGDKPDVFLGKPWGVEKLSIAERHYKVIMAGGDQFGGNNVAGPVLEAYAMGLKEFGEPFMRKRFEQSAIRLLRNIFQTGLFENPYLDPEISKTLVGQPAFMKEGFEAQLKSVIMLKNRNKLLPLQKTKTIYIPKRTIPAGRDWFGNITPERIEAPVSEGLAGKYFNVTDDPSKADVAVVFIKSPQGMVGYSRDDKSAGGNGYVPISLKYGEYKATLAREQSLAYGDPVIDSSNKNRSYRDKTITASNITDLQTVMDTRKLMNGKPVVVVMDLSNPTVVAEFEKDIDALLVGLGVQNQAILEILSGKHEPHGLLPFQMPAGMTTVEEQMEDQPHDMIPYRDSEGNVYDFAFGLNWKGKIHDQRVKKYKK